ncbi:LolA family protein [Empedobacter brevis]|uniref:LolA family protein n=1 Tax=Empedobacter brevis TaxID=247 RepID=UPI0039AECCDD
MSKLTFSALMISFFSFTAFAQNAEKIIETHIQKTGGEAAWNSLNSIILRGEAIINVGDSYPMIVYHQRPYNKKVVFVMNGKEILNEGYDGNVGWTYSEVAKKNVPVKDYKPDSFDSDILKYKQKGFKVKYLGIDKYDQNNQNNSCYKIELTKNANSTVYCFDKNSYEIVMEKNKDETLYYSNFKNYNGLSFATKVVGKPTEGGEYVIKFNDIKINPAIDKKNFKF